MNEKHFGEMQVDRRFRNGMISVTVEPSRVKEGHTNNEVKDSNRESLVG